MADKDRDTLCISAIAALSKHNRGIGKDNKLLWKIPDDLKRVKRLTEGTAIIMGRKTYESIGKPLPNRLNIVVSRNKRFAAEEVVVRHSLEEALEEAQKKGLDEIFIFGGAQIYEEALPRTNRLYLTLIDDEQPADAFFPEYADQFKKVISREKRETKDGLPYEWVVLERG